MRRLLFHNPPRVRSQGAESRSRDTLIWYSPAPKFLNRELTGVIGSRLHEECSVRQEKPWTVAPHDGFSLRIEYVLP